MGLSSEMIAQGAIFYAIQLFGFFVLGYYLRTNKENFLREADGKNPLLRPGFFLFAIIIAVGVFGLVFSVGRGWFFILQSPFIVCLIIIRLKQRYKTEDK